MHFILGVVILIGILWFWFLSPGAFDKLELNLRRNRMSLVISGRNTNLGEVAFVIDITIRIGIGDDRATRGHKAAGAVDGAASRVSHLCVKTEAVV